MATKKSVYENVLSQYTELRNDFLKKESDYQVGIEKARADLKDNADKMAAAISKGEQETYTQLHNQNLSLEATISYFEESLKNLHKNNGIDPKTVEGMIKSIDGETARLQSEYDAKLVELLKPVIDYTVEMKYKLAVVSNARNKISKNLAHDRFGQSIASFDSCGFPTVNRVESLADILAKDYKKNADEEMKKKYSSEIKKWF